MSCEEDVIWARRIIAVADCEKGGHRPVAEFLVGTRLMPVAIVCDCGNVKWIPQRESGEDVGSTKTEVEVTPEEGGGGIGCWPPVEGSGGAGGVQVGDARISQTYRPPRGASYPIRDNPQA